MGFWKKFKEEHASNDLIKSWEKIAGTPIQIGGGTGAPTDAGDYSSGGSSGEAGSSVSTTSESIGNAVEGETTAGNAIKNLAIVSTPTLLSSASSSIPAINNNTVTAAATSVNTGLAYVQKAKNLADNIADTINSFLPQADIQEGPTYTTEATYENQSPYAASSVVPDTKNYIMIASIAIILTILIKAKK